MIFRRGWLASVCLLLMVAGCGGGGGTRTVTPTAPGNLQGFVFARTLASGSAVPAPATPSQHPGGTVPLPGATVTLSSGAQATTGADGAFRIANVAPGSYTATVQQSTVYSSSFPVTVVSGQTVRAGAANGQTVMEPTAQATQRQWTVLVYLDADNDLSQDGPLNLNQMESVGSDGNVNIVVQFDGSGPAPAGSTRRYVVERGTDPNTITSPVLQELGELDMAQPATMQQFITWAMAHYPADHTLFVPWNHGAGWRAHQTRRRGIIFDDTSSTFMTMAQFNAGMTVPGVHFDLTAIDASLMAMIEVEYEIRDRTDLISASEQSPPATGYPYDKILSALAASPGQTPQAFGQAIVSLYVANYPNQGVTQSLVQTSRLAALGQKVNSLGAALQAALPASQAQIAQARSMSQPYTTPDYVDLVDLAGHLGTVVPSPAVQSAAAAVIAAVPAANGGPVLFEQHSGPTVAASHGLSIYLAAPGTFVTEYNNLAFSRSFPNWTAFVQAFGT